jgi:hypothetical protein
MVAGTSPASGQPRDLSIPCPPTARAGSWQGLSNAKATGNDSFLIRPRMTEEPKVPPDLQSSSGSFYDVVGASGFDSWPLSNRASAGPLWFPSRRTSAGPCVGTLLWPARRRIFPWLLTSIHREVHQSIAVVHCFHATPGCPVCLENPRPSA